MPEFSSMQQLVDYLNHTAHAYYVLDNPIISDAEWDKLYNQLLKMEQETGIVLPDSPSHRVGGEPLKGFEEVISDGFYGILGNRKHKSALNIAAK